jgi:hypothetical protein
VTEPDAKGHELGPVSPLTVEDLLTAQIKTAQIETAHR